MPWSPFLTPFGRYSSASVRSGLFRVSRSPAFPATFKECVKQNNSRQESEITQYESSPIGGYLALVEFSSDQFPAERLSPRARQFIRHGIFVPISTYLGSLELLCSVVFLQLRFLVREMFEFLLHLR